jgi:elongation factor Ts
MDIAAADVVALRKQTGAGMMDCKKALVAADGDVEKATEALRAKGMAIANKKGARDTSQGLIKTYVHTGGQLGVMVEVLCETDFVAKNPQFIEFANDICLQLAADQGVSCIKEEDIDPAYLAEQRRLEMQSETLEGKPDDIKEKIVEGRVQKIVKENALLSRQFVKNPDITVQDHLTKTIATIGENIVIKRFTRMTLGEEE